MIRSMSTRARRALALGILTILLIGLAAFTWLPFAIFYEQEFDIAQLDTRVRTLEAHLQTRDQLIAERLLLKRASEADPTLVQAETPALAGAEMQRVLTSLIEAVGGVVESVQVLEPTTRAPFVQISIRVHFTSSIDSLQAFLYAVENHAPVLLVHELDVTKAIRDDTGGESKSPQLYSNIETWAFARLTAAQMQISTVDTQYRDEIVRAGMER